MNILVCVSEYPPHGSGIADVASRMVREFEKQGHMCTVCSPTGPDIRLGSRWLIKRFGGLGLLYFWWHVGRRFAGKASGWDAVWLHWPMFPFSCPFPAALATFHGTYRGFHGMARETHSPLHVRDYYRIMESLERRSLRRLRPEAIRFSAVSAQAVQELADQGVPAERISCIPVGVDTDFFRSPVDKAALRARLDIPQDAQVFLFVGRLSRPKNLFKLVDVFARLKSMPEASNSLLLIAGEGELAGSLARHIAGKRVEGVRMLGFVPRERLPGLYGAADFFVMASSYEGQPVALLEAMACGLPAIVSPIPALSRLVDESGAGLAVDFAQTDQAAATIHQYLTGPAFTSFRKDFVSGLSSSGCAGRYLVLLTAHANVPLGVPA